MKPKYSIMGVSNVIFPKGVIDEEETLMNFEAEISCEEPGNNIYRFDGLVKLNSSSNSNDVFTMSYPISADNLLLRGSSLKHTECIYGAVVYVGHDSRIMQNSSNSKIKLSRNEKMLNRLIIYIFLLQLSLCFFAAIYGTEWMKNNKTTEYYLNISLTN